MSEKEDTSTTKTDKSKEESKLDKVLDSLENIKGLLETKDIPPASGKTRWEQVLTRGFEDITDEKEQFKEVQQFFVSLGLGRGVDVTRTKPFHNKTAFQIKQVDYSNLIGTDEGGLLVDFIKTVYSTRDTSVKYQASLDVMKALGKHVPALTGPLTAVSAPFTFTASGELSRSEHAISVVLGLRILNRTVSFRQTMDSVPTSLVQLVPLKDMNVITSDSVLLRTHVQFLEKLLEGRDTRQLTEEQYEQAKKVLEQLKEKDTFEKRLTKWIVEYYIHTKKISEEEAEKITLDDIKDENMLETLCEAYTWSTGVTHYVSSIKLGAEMYKTMDQRGYETTFKSNASVNVFDIFTVNEDKDKERGISREARDIQKKYVTKVIGRITEATNGTGGDDKGTEKDALDVHPRKSYKVDPRDEAVIGYELRSVASLIVKNEKLAEKMAMAARRYIDEKRREKVGPYYIASHDMKSGKTVYLKRGQQSTLTTTINQSEASSFKIIPDEDDEKKEFHIVYEAKDDKDDPDTPTFRYYLTTRHKFSGAHSEPPSLEQHPKESNATFALHSQLHEWINTQEKLEEWISEGECFLINCENRKWIKDPYFALERDKEDGPLSHKFFPVCVRYTNENDDLLLAFKLIRCPPTYQKKITQQE